MDAIRRTLEDNPLIFQVLDSAIGVLRGKDVCDDNLVNLFQQLCVDYNKAGNGLMHFAAKLIPLYTVGLGGIVFFGDWRFKNGKKREPMSLNLEAESRVKRGRKGRTGEPLVASTSPHIYLPLIVYPLKCMYNTYSE